MLFFTDCTQNHWGKYSLCTSHADISVHTTEPHSCWPEFRVWQCSHTDPGMQRRRADWRMGCWRNCNVSNKTYNSHKLFQCFCPIGISISWKCSTRGRWAWNSRVCSHWNALWQPRSDIRYLRYLCQFTVHCNTPYTGVEDSSGMEFFYSNTPPAHEAAVLPLGHTVTPTMIIPPNTENYVIEGICPGKCTDQVSEYMPIF